MTRHGAVELAHPTVIDIDPISVRDVVFPAPGPEHPLYETRLTWHGPVSPEEAERIHARHVYAQLRWWRRLTTAAPEGWRS